MKPVLLVALGGALGTVGRYLTGRAVTALWGDRLPYGTFAVNLLGSLIIGAAMMVLISRDLHDSGHRMTLVVGFLGGFTTYSSFAFETVALLERRQLVAAAGYVTATLLLCALACYGGMLLARAVGFR